MIARLAARLRGEVSPVEVECAYCDVWFVPGEPGTAGVYCSQWCADLDAELDTVQELTTVRLLPLGVRYEDTPNGGYVVDVRAMSPQELFARLQACEKFADTRAAARVLDGLSATAEGRWMLRQMAAAGFRALGSAVPS